MVNSLPVTQPDAIVPNVPTGDPAPDCDSDTSDYDVIDCTFDSETGRRSVDEVIAYIKKKVEGAPKRSSRERKVVLYESDLILILDRVTQSIQWEMKLRRRLDALERTIEALKDNAVDVNKVIAQVARLRAELAIMQSEVDRNSDLRRTCEKQEAQIEQMRKEIKACMKECEKMRKQSEDSDKETIELLKVLKILMNANASLHRQQDEFNEEIRKIEETLPSIVEEQFSKTLADLEKNATTTHRGTSP